MSDKKRKTDARALENYLENREAYADGLAPDVERLVDSLQQWRHEHRLQPRAGFTNELAGQLKDERSQARRTWAVWPVLSRVLAGAGAVAALLLFAFFISSLFRGPVGPITSDETETVGPTLQATGGMFEGVEFRLDAPLGAAAQELPLYVVEAVQLPETPEAVREMAMGLQMENPRLYESAGMYEGWIVEDEAGRTLTIVADRVRFSIIYHAPVETAPEATRLPYADARAAALDLLDGAGLLPDEYVAREQLNEVGDNLTRVEIIPTLQGLPVHYASSEIAVTPDGTVVEVRSQLLSMAPTGETITMQPAQEAFATVLESGGTMDGRHQSQNAMASETYYPTFDDAERGTEVNLIGYVTALTPVDDAAGGEPLLKLLHHPEGVGAFEIEGAAASGMANEYLVEVSGTLVRPLPGGGWRVEADGWRALDIENAPECQSGVLQREAEAVSFLRDEGETLTLAYPPDVADGDRAYVCAAFAAATEETALPWLSITSPVTEDFTRVLSSAEAPISEEENASPFADRYETLDIEWAVPGYLHVPATQEEAAGQQLQPTWLFYGQSPDGTLQFVVRAPAVATEVEP